MAGNDPYDAFSSPVSRKPSRKETLEQAGKEAGIASSQTSTAKGQAELPYVASLAKEELRSKQDTNIQRLANDFSNNPTYKRFDAAIVGVGDALRTAPDAAGDIALTYAAAKVFDPDSAVRDAEQQALGNTTSFLERAMARIRKEFGLPEGGTFSPAAREKLRREVYTKGVALAQSYDRLRQDYTKKAEARGYNPEDIVGTHLSAPFRADIEAFEKRQRAGTQRSQEESRSADIFRGIPEGTRVAGEDIKGWRFSPETEADITSYYSDPRATAEGYAAMIADKAVAEGHIPSEQREDYFKRNLEASKDFFTLPPEERAKTKGVDYSAIDKAASENAGLVASVAQGIRNIPESTAQLAEGVVHTPQGIAAAAQLAAKIAQGEFDDPMVQAAKDMLEERYGSLDALQRTAIKDPVGIAGDLSLLLTGGGAAASRVPGMVRVGEAASAAGRAIDPLAGLVKLGTEGVPAAYTAAKARKPGMMEGIENIPSEIVGLPSGIGGQAVREAAGAGFERGMAGGPTARSEAFTEGMRRPGESAETIVDAARDAVAKLREQAGNQYRQAMQNFGQNPVPLDIDVVRQRMAKIKPRNYDAMIDAPNRPRQHVAWEQMNDTVNYYAQQAADNPSLLEPMAMDAFKQDLYDIGSKIGGAYDRDAARIAKTAYTAVRQELVKHDPVYADIMKNYEKAAVEARELEDMFSLGQARGKPVKVDTAARKLQSIMRNNANTNYGMRAKRGERLAELDETGTLMAANAGQMASAPTARGITRGVVAGGTVPGAGIAAALNPATLFASVPLMAATSPRLTGELAYGAGRLTGTGVKVAKDISQSQLGQGVTTTAKAIADLYQKYPELGLAGAQLGSRAQETEAERLKRLYGIPTIAAGE